MVNPQHGNPNGGDNLETGSFPSYMALLLQQATWPFGASVFLSVTWGSPSLRVRGAPRPGWKGKHWDREAPPGM